MSKKSRILIIVTVIIITAVVGFLIFKPGKRELSTNVVKAIPTNTPMFLKVNNIEDLSETINNSTISKLIFSNEGFNSLNNFAEAFDSMATQMPDFIDLMNEDGVTIAFSYGGKSELTSTFYLKLKSSVNPAKIANAIENYLGNSHATLQSRKYNNSEIYEIQNPKGQQVFTYSYYKGVLIISQKGFMVENSLRQLDENTFQTTPEFEMVRKTANSSADINLFINHNFSEKVFTNLFSKNIETFIKYQKVYTSWSELDVNLEENEILLNGFSIANKNYSLFSKVLEKQTPVSSELEHILPNSIAFFSALNLSNIDQFFIDYEQFQKEQNELLIRENKLNQIKTEFEGGIQELFKTIMSGEICTAGFNINNNLPNEGRVFILSTQSGSQALQLLKEVQNKFITTHKEEIANWVSPYVIDSETSYDLYKWPYKKLPQIMFGDLFENINAEYFTIIDNYLVFADGERTLRNLIMANIHGDLLAGNSSYKSFKSVSENKSSFTYYINTEFSLSHSNLFFNEELSKSLIANKDNYKIKSIGWQVAPSNSNLYNTGYILFNETVKSKPKTVWQSSLGSGFEFKPQFTVNHTDKANKEIVIQDLDNNFYLINNIGRILWNIQLDSKIMGEVHQIDIYQNGKLQYLFNTKNKLYLLDRNGDNVSGFPINLKAAATNAVSVIDYDNNRNYRFFISGIDRKIYAYDRNGKTLKGWNQFQTDHLVTSPLKHFRIANKDYLVVTDGMKDYLLSRKGEIRVPTSEVYAHGANSELYLEEENARIVTTDEKGTLHFIDFKGNYETKAFETFSNQHFFTIADLNGDGNNEYLFADNDELFIYNSSGKRILKQSFDGPISFQPNVYQFSSTNRKIGIVIQKESEIHLIDLEGNEHYGFPLEGKSPFSIGFISDKNENFNLLVSSRDNYLYNYFVE